MPLSTLSIVALVVLALVATVLVVIAAIRLGRDRRPEPREAGGRGPRWFEILFAIVLLAALAMLAITALDHLTSDAVAPGDWRAGPRSDLFLGVMLAAVSLALLFLLVFVVARTAPRSATGAGSEPGAPAEAVAQPPASRLVGLLLLAIGILLLGWIYLAPAARAALVVHALYPASIAVALVLLFDKATRSWTPKNALEGFREWLLCDVIVIALILGFVNLQQLESHDTYGGFFWDVLHVAGFFLAFWFLDRTSLRGRFLVAFFYLALLPLLLLMWRWSGEIETADDIALWSSVWPVFFLSLAFFVLEIISLLAHRGTQGQVVPVIKDAAFVVLYATFLIAAIPGSD